MDADKISALMAILGVILAIALPFAAAVMTLRLIDRAAQENKQPVKLVLADLFCLMFMVQIPLAFFVSVHANRSPPRILRENCKGLAASILAKFALGRG